MTTGKCLKSSIINSWTHLTQAIGLAAGPDGVRAGKYKFLRIPWWYHLQSNVVAFEGWDVQYTVNSGQKIDRKEFYLINSRECQADTLGSLARTGKCDGWKSSKCTWALPGIQGIAKKKFERNSRTGYSINDPKWGILGICKCKC